MGEVASYSRADSELGILHVPVSVCAANIVSIRTGRLASGERVGLGFTSAARLAAVFGSGQAWILIHLRPLREMLASRGITTVEVDPLTRPAARGTPRILTPAPHNGTVLRPAPTRAAARSL